MCETKRMPNLVEANCESCIYCMQHEDLMELLLGASIVDRKQLALGCCTRRTPNLLVTLVSSCKEWKSGEI